MTFFLGIFCHPLYRKYPNYNTKAFPCGKLHKTISTITRGNLGDQLNRINAHVFTACSLASLRSLLGAQVSSLGVQFQASRVSLASRWMPSNSRGNLGDVLNHIRTYVFTACSLAFQGSLLGASVVPRRLIPGV